MRIAQSWQPVHDVRSVDRRLLNAPRAEEQRGEPRQSAGVQVTRVMEKSARKANPARSCDGDLKVAIREEPLPCTAGVAVAAVAAVGHAAAVSLSETLGPHSSFSQPRQPSTN